MEGQQGAAEDVQDVGIDDLVERAGALVADGRRRILGITGSPGAGKSMVSEALALALAGQAVVVSMDGFHLANRELRRLGRAELKGAPDTFDTGGYVALLQRLRAQSENVVYAPYFDRGLEESIGSSVAVFANVPLVITEGNYLLLADHGWNGVREHLDEAWFLDVSPAVRRERLIRRRISFGHSPDSSAVWVASVDERNAAIVDLTRVRADLLVRVTTALAPPPVGQSEG